MTIADRAREIIANIRAGQLDPRPAAEALGLPFDQDIIMAILERAAWPTFEEDLAYRINHPTVAHGGRRAAKSPGSGLG
jgi:hypothetical protein